MRIHFVKQPPCPLDVAGGEQIVCLTDLSPQFLLDAQPTAVQSGQLGLRMLIEHVERSAKDRGARHLMTRPRRPLRVPIEHAPLQHGLGTRGILVDVGSVFLTADIDQARRLLKA